MSRSGLGYALLLSLLLNVGVIGATGYHAVRDGRLPSVFVGGSRTALDLPDHLGLDASQRRSWRDLERGFLQDFDAGGAQIMTHRGKLIREIFSDHPDPGRIESERIAIASLQERQQQRVIAQFLKERQILDTRQRTALADLLLQETPNVPLERQLHRP